MDTPVTGVRVPPELIAAARTHLGEPNVPVSTLLRAGLAVLAGLTVRDAIKSAQARPGPKPRERGAG